jgi:REP element-mobilizing transposase RayT
MTHGEFNNPKTNLLFDKQLHQIMASTLVKIDVHIIFHTKANQIEMRRSDIPHIHKYLGGIIKNLNSIPICIGGTSDHVHILCSLPKTMALSDFVRNIKAYSSRWIKTLDNHYKEFEWQTGYGAFSVSPSILTRTVNYINGQEEHHKKKSFIDEYTAFLEAYNIRFDPDFLLDK